MNKPEHMTPLYWGLFAAGGTTAALLLVTTILIFSVLLPFGMIGDAATLRANALDFIGHPIVYMLLAGVFFTFLWHALHRFFYVLHDFHIHVGYGFRSVLYAIAIIALLVTLAVGWF